MSELVTIYRPGGPTGEYDTQGNPVLAEPAIIPVQAIAVAPIQGEETAGSTGPVSINGYTVYLPFGTDIRASDWMTVRGVDGWHVEADAAQGDWVSPFTSWKPGTVAVLRRAS